MKKTALSIIFLMLPFSSFASLGRKLVPQELPHGLCRITLENKKTGDSFHCTGSHIGKQLIKTASHCLQNSVVTKVECTGEEKNIEVEEVLPFPDYNHTEVTQEEANRWQDHALIKTKNVLKKSPMTIVVDKSTWQEVVSQSDQCMITGFGLQEQASYGTGFLSGSLYSPSKLKKIGRMFYAKGSYKFELLPGDSGGPLLCLYKNTWHDLGTASAHDWDHNSLYAPNHEVTEWFEKFNLNTKRLKHSKVPNRIAPIVSKVKVGHTYFLLPYTLIRNEVENFYNGDIRHSSITITSIDGDRISGLVNSNGASQFFLCSDAFLCYGQEVQGEVLFSDLAGEKLFIPSQPFDPFK